MRKLKLKVEELEITSFETGRDAGGDGTVKGNMPHAPASDHTCPEQDTCAEGYTCPASCENGLTCPTTVCYQVCRTLGGGTGGTGGTGIED